jgi:hypothetical protein
MIPAEPDCTAYNAAEEPWRIVRLIRTDGRVRELLRMLTPESLVGEGSEGERIWASHVIRLHDERGRIEAHCSAALGTSSWLPVIALALARAWDGEDEREVAFLVEGETIPWPLDSILLEP